MNKHSRFILESRALLGLERSTTSHAEKLISGLGAVLGMWAVYLIAQWVCGAEPTPLLVASMAASAVLLFAVPHGALSQPWAVIGGHMFSAFIGVSCQRLFPGQLWTGALAVGLAVTAMHYLRCIHPPGGATALVAVIGGPEIHNLGYWYLLTPVLLNTAAILGAATLFNGCFAWRRYPAHWARRRKGKPVKAEERQFELTQEDFAAAMEQLDSYVDITAESLTELLELAKQHAEKNITHPAEIIAGHFYSNGKLGNLWSIRQVVDASGGDDSKDRVIYKVLAGAGAYEIAICGRDEFRQWARFEVVPQNGRWIKIAGADSA
jgi:CBS domain-containing membrane protein